MRRLSSGRWLKMNEVEIQKARIDALEKQTAIQAARLEKLENEFDWAKRQVWILFAALSVTSVMLTLLLVHWIWHMRP